MITLGSAVAKDPESAVHGVRPALYLAFSRDEAQYNTLGGRFSRLMQGPFDHVEIVFGVRRALQRVIVPRPSPQHPEARVFRDFIPFSRSKRWEFLRIPCTHEQLGRISIALSGIIERGDYFSERAMWRAGFPPLPACVTNAMVPEEARASGGPTFCSKMCVEGLHAGGMLEWLPADFTIASDLWVAAKVHLDAYPEEPIMERSQTDSAGYRVNLEKVFKS